MNERYLQEIMANLNGIESNIKELRNVLVYEFDVRNSSEEDGTVLKRISQNLDEAKEFVKLANKQSDSFL
ncbi:hypothetical protein [Streptococcus salivarius]|uniref:hypothetical protein n=1 Tax=Streptococcus salivarius TaxID=1304 RepID=UPI0034A46B0B